MIRQFALPAVAGFLLDKFWSGGLTVGSQSVIGLTNGHGFNEPARLSNGRGLTVIGVH